VSDVGEASSFWFLNGHVSIHLSKEANGDGISMIEHLLPRDFGPPFHIHHDEDETFYLLEGEVRFKRGDTILHARAGEVVYLPKGIPHGFKVLSDRAKVLTLTRGGFETMVRRVSRPASSVTLPEQLAPTPEMQAFLATACAENGIDLLGPPID
jgi:mannose-6-phosphate isomerase-like protein (cupin superfamily)